jgi:hypothetical protein
MATYAEVFFCNQNMYLDHQNLSQIRFWPQLSFPMNPIHVSQVFKICMLLVCLQHMCDLMCLYAWKTFHHLYANIFLRGYIQHY